MLLRPLPYAGCEHIVRVWSTSGAEPKGAHAPADFLDFQHANRTMRNLAGYREDAFTITGSAGEPVRVEGAQVTVDYFDVLGVPAALGRAFTRASDAAGGEPLVVLGHDMWVQQFASDPQVVNRRSADQRRPAHGPRGDATCLRLSRRRASVGAVATTRPAAAD